MRINDLLQDHTIPFDTSGKNCKPGWINVRCPFCDDQSNHLGLKLSSNATHCWKCGSHDRMEAVSRLLNVSFDAALRIAYKYKGQSTGFKEVTKPERQATPVSRITYPSGTTKELSRVHTNYIKERGFDYKELQDTWDIRATSKFSYLKLDDKTIDLSYRIVIPIFWKNKVVSYQTRDVTNTSKLKYITCPRPLERIHHKHIIYKHPTYPTKIGICCEGVVDVWRLGNIAFSTFGIEFSQQQLRVIAQTYDTVYILYDRDEPGKRQSEILKQELLFRGLEVIDVGWMMETYHPRVKDPADLTSKQARDLVALIIRTNHRTLR